MGSGNGNDFLNSDFPMYAAAGVGLFGVYRAFVVSYVCRPFGRLSPYWLLQFAYQNQIRKLASCRRSELEGITLQPCENRCVRKPSALRFKME